MTVRRSPAALDAAIAVAALLALVWFAGGQALLGRIDPALVLPWLALVLVPFVILERSQQARGKKPCSPAKAGAHLRPVQNSADRRWAPAFAGAQGIFAQG